MTVFTPIGDYYKLNQPYSPAVGSLYPGQSWENELLCISREIYSALGAGAGLDVYIMDTLTGLRLPTVIREDGVHALAVDTEISIDNATLKINNLFTASTDGTVAGAAYMRMTAAALSDSFVPPASGLLQVQNFNMLYDFAGGSWSRALGMSNDIDSLSESADTNKQATISYLMGYIPGSTDWWRIRASSGVIDDYDLSGYGDGIGSLQTQNFLMGYNVTSTFWDRLQSIGNNIDTITPTDRGILQTINHLTAYDPNNTTWNRVSTNNFGVVDSVDLSGYDNGKYTLQVQNFNMGYNESGSVWDRLYARGNGQDNVSSIGQGVLETNSYMMYFDQVGADWNRQDEIATEATAQAILAAIGGGTTTTASNDSVQTTVAGNTYQVLNTAACERVTFVNDTGVDLEVQQDGAGVALPVFAGSFFTFEGITNANQLGVRRVDLSVTQVTVKYRLEA